MMREAIVMVGESPRERAPVLWLRVRKGSAPRCEDRACGRAASKREAGVAIDDASRVALIWDGVDLATRT